MDRELAITDQSFTLSLYLHSVNDWQVMISRSPADRPGHKIGTRVIDRLIHDYKPDIMTHVLTDGTIR